MNKYLIYTPARQSDYDLVLLLLIKKAAPGLLHEPKKEGHAWTAVHEVAASQLKDTTKL